MNFGVAEHALTRPTANIASTAFLLLLCSLLVPVAIIDARHGIIPDWLNGALGGIGLIRAAAGDGPPLGLSVAVAVGVFFFMVLLCRGFARWRGSAGMGMGDVKFLAAAATWTGLSGLPTLMVVSSISGLLLVVWRAVFGTPVTSTTRLAFGPHLAIGLGFAELFGSIF
jgi:leader peptidase (prepilin peptidase)/N-methyltransferase